jgi:alpha-beta hydrolase superfamily lysophospholipase
MNTQAAHIQAIVKTAPAMAPGAATVTAEWMGIINTGLSIILITLSIAFLVWRWRVSYNKLNK